MSDNELDNLFKEAADGFKAPNDPSAWENMSARLDQAAVTSTFWNWKTLSLMTVIGITTVGLLWYAATNQSEPIGTKAPANNLTNIISKKNISSTSNADSSSAPQVETRDVMVNKNEIGRKNIAEKKNDSNSNGSLNATAISAGQEKVSGVSKISSSQNSVSDNQLPKYQEEKIKLENTGIRNGDVATSATISIVLSSEINNPNQLTAETGTQVSQVNSSSSKADSVSELTETQKEEVNAKNTSKDVEEKPEKSNRINSPFAIKLAIAPDYSAVKSSTPDGLGMNFGALFEYRINEHWSVATGGIWTKKIYTVYDVEYNGRKADKVNGDCRMWDIPINLYYNFFPSKRFSFYSALGLSSYIMNEENYVYTIVGSRGTYNYTQQIKGENNEWFKTLNVSVGMQWRMNTNFSFQFEPTLKAPLAGVGEGEVSLVSLGAFLNLRYEIPILKKSGGNDKIK